jgi:hypothetical protein
LRFTLQRFNASTLQRMIAGLTNLDTLKKHLLATSQMAETRFDLVIQTLGLGIAGLFDTLCNRRLAYLDADQVVFSGDRPHYYLPRFPIRNVTSIQMRYFQTDNWTDITGQPISVNYETGLIHFGYTLGRNPMQVRVVWDGGYWFEPLEPEDAQYPSNAPVAGTDPNGLPARFFILPDTLRSAFLFQCEAAWSQRDKLGLGLTDKPGEQSGLGKLDLAPMVKSMLNPFIRYQLS